MRRNVIADELIMVGLIITQSPSCARTVPLVEETPRSLRFWTNWGAGGGRRCSPDADILQHGGDDQG